jgi:hypothetical protein
MRVRYQWLIFSIRSVCFGLLYNVVLVFIQSVIGLMYFYKEYFFIKITYIYIYILFVTLIYKTIEKQEK